MVKSGFVERNLKVLFPLPAVIFVVVMMLFPVVYTVFLSFTNWNLTSGMALKVVGLKSYLRVFSEPRFLDAIGRTFAFTGMAIAMETLLGVSIAIVLNRQFRGKGLVKLLLLLPLMATPVAVGLVFNLFYDPTIGLANWVLTLVGLPKLEWVSNAATALPSLVLVDVWQWTPMITLICLAGLAALPSDPYESAVVDGANPGQILRHITLPMLMPTILTSMILRSVDALKTFDIIFAMTGGGPGYASETLNILSFKYSFEYFKMGQASVMLVTLFILVLLSSVGIMKLRNWVEA
jgi:multiple sugar transport system permease protein